MGRDLICPDKNKARVAKAQWTRLGEGGQTGREGGGGWAEQAGSCHLGKGFGFYSKCQRNLSEGTEERN